MDLDLSSIFLVLFLLAPLMALIVSLLADGSRLEIPNGIQALEWPHGVQEEEPVRWRVERLSRPRRQEPEALVTPRRGGVDGPRGELGSKPAA
jgi:hypothetical protein